MRKLTVLLTMAGLCLFGLASAGVAASLIGKGELIVGTEGTWPPYEYYDEDNKLTGFDIELVYALGRQLGKKVTVVDMAFDGLIPALLTRKIDVIAAGMHSTAERKKRIDFSDVYSYADSALVVKYDNDSIESVDDMEGKVIGTQFGTTEDIFLSQRDNIDIKRYQKAVDAVRDVMLDRNDGVLIGTVVARSYVESGSFKGGLKIAFRHDVDKPDEGFALALRKNDPQFLEAVNAALKELDNSGVLPALKVKYGLD
ncbi:MAG: transporter substrate-binding domain-containing protein [Synergistaceae bacterium]|nr:transporter substrate-binding domain-containing protein [Synergistaceae bacterium]